MVEWKSEIAFEPAPVDLADLVGWLGLTIPRPWPSLSPGPVDPVIIIDRQAWDEMRTYAASADVEIGGLLVGEALRDVGTGRLVTLVRGAIPAVGGHSTSVHFTFTQKAWEHLTTERDARWPELITVGWFHSHPNLGVFYSGTDVSTQRAFFNQPWNIGIVVDPFARRTDAVGVFVGGRSIQVPASNLLITELDRAAVATPSDLAVAAHERERSVWEELGPRVAFIAASTAAGMAIAVLADRLRNQRGML